MKTLVATLAAAMLALSVPQAQTGGSILFVGNSFTFAAGSPVRFYRADTVTDLNKEGIGGMPGVGGSGTAGVGGAVGGAS